MVGAEDSHADNSFVSCGVLSPDRKQDIPLSSVFVLSPRDM